MRSASNPGGAEDVVGVGAVAGAPAGIPAVDATSAARAPAGGRRRPRRTRPGPTCCGCVEQPRRGSTGATHASAPENSAAHSSRLRVRKTRRPRLELRPADGSSWRDGRPVEAEPGHEARRRTAARWRRPRQYLPSAALVGVVERRAGVEEVGAPLVGPAALAHAAEHRRHRAARRRRPSRRRRPGPGPTSPARPARTTHAEREQHAAAAEVADEVERRRRRLAGAADVREHARRRRCS